MAGVFPLKFTANCTVRQDFVKNVKKNGTMPSLSYSDEIFLNNVEANNIKNGK